MTVGGCAGWTQYFLRGTVECIPATILVNGLESRRDLYFMEAFFPGKREKTLALSIVVVDPRLST